MKYQHLYRMKCPHCGKEIEGVGMKGWLINCDYCHKEIKMNKKNIIFDYGRIE